MNSGKYGPHLADRGYNGVQLSQLSNCWVRGVDIVDADNGVFVAGSDFVTLAGGFGGGGEVESRQAGQLASMQHGHLQACSVWPTAAAARPLPPLFKQT